MNKNPDLKKELPESQFIHEGYKQDPGNIWAWFFFLAAIMAVVWGAGSWYVSYLSSQQESRPFLQVTNRDLSLFLWQHPQYLRANAKAKTGYLPAFQYLDKVSVEPRLADQYAVAPPELLFQYHVWNRLVGKELSLRTIPTKEFITFLDYCEEWRPKYWPEAPAAYKDTLEALDPKGELDLAQLPETTIPRVVRIAFQGWKNFMYEGDAINRFKPTYQQVEAFLKQHPTYARNYWQNIYDTETVHYLMSVAVHPPTGDPIPDNELVPFLRAALYNAAQIAKNP